MIKNQYLRIPPDHPYAADLSDLIGLQFVVLERMNDEAALANAGGDRASFDRHEKALAMIAVEIVCLQQKYRIERGADESCTVGLTYDERGRPVVKRKPVLTLVESSRPQDASARGPLVAANAAAGVTIH